LVAAPASAAAAAIPARNCSISFWTLSICGVILA
jgi:hypothetical protein